MRRTVQRDAHAYEKKPCYHIENLANLDKLPKDLVFTFIRAPLLMKDFERVANQGLCPCSTSVAAANGWENTKLN